MGNGPWLSLAFQCSQIFHGHVYAGTQRSRVKFALTVITPKKTEDEHVHTLQAQETPRPPVHTVHLHSHATTEVWQCRVIHFLFQDRAVNFTAFSRNSGNDQFTWNDFCFFSLNLSHIQSLYCTTAGKLIIWKNEAQYANEATSS